MHKFNGVLVTNEIKNLQWHRIEGKPEIAYTFSDSSDDYCILANNIDEMLITSDDEIVPSLFALDFWIKGSTEGCQLTVDDLQQCYDDDVYAAYSLYNFDSACFLVKHDSSVCIPVPESYQEELRKFFFGDPNYTKPTLSERFESSGLVQLNGEFTFVNYSSDRAELIFRNSDFHFTAAKPIFVSQNCTSEVRSLYYDEDQEIKNDIIEYHYNPTGILCMDLIYRYLYVLYDGPNGPAVSFVNYKFGTFYFKGYFFIVQNNVAIKIPCPESDFSEDDHYRYIRFSDFTLECALRNVNAAYFHVVGFMRTNERGEKIRWGGEAWSLSDLQKAGMDHDLTDHSLADDSQMNNSITTERYTMDSSSDTATEDLQPVKTPISESPDSHMQDNDDSENLNDELSDLDDAESEVPAEYSDEANHDAAMEQLDHTDQEALTESSDSATSSDNEQKEPVIKAGIEFTDSLDDVSKLDPLTLFRNVNIEKLQSILLDSTLTI